MAGNEDDRQINAEFTHLVLEFQAAHAGHANVENEAAGTLEIAGADEVQGIGIDCHIPAFTLDQKGP